VKPVVLYGPMVGNAPDKDIPARVFAMVDPAGQSWHISVAYATGELLTYMVPTVPGRPDNGTLNVSRLLRQRHGITGTFQSI
jgi:hypothetical protein